MISRTLRFFGTERVRRTFLGSRRPITSKGKEGGNSKIFFCSTIVIDADGARSAKRLDVARPPIPQPRITTLSFDGNVKWSKVEDAKGNNPLRMMGRRPPVRSYAGASARVCCFEEVVTSVTMLLLGGSLPGFGRSGGGGVVSLLPRSRNRTTVLISRLVQP